MKYEQPLVIINVLGFLDDSALALRIAKTPLVNSEHIVIALFGDQLRDIGVLVRVRPIAVYVEADSFAGLLTLSRIAIGLQINLFFELSDD